MVHSVCWNHVFHRHHPTKLRELRSGIIKPETADRLSGTQILGAPILPCSCSLCVHPDEIEQRTEKEINPTPQRVSPVDISGDTVTTTQSAQESSVNVDSLADDFRERIESAQDVDSAKSLRADIETAKATLGSALFTELKTKP